MPFGDESEIYEEHILEHYEDPYHNGPCEHATHADEGKNPLCGDIVRIELDVDDSGSIRQAWFEGQGCVISQASASMIVEELEGKSLEEVRNFTAEDMLNLFGARLTPNRQKCCLLPWRVFQSALYAPVNEDGEDDSPHFQGPNLGEES